MSYRIVFVLFVGVGSDAKLNLVWSLSDTFNGLMAIPNLIALLALSPIIVKETRNYFIQKYETAEELGLEKAPGSSEGGES